MGAAGIDVALETRDVALMSDKIEKAFPLYRVKQKNPKAIIKQTLWIKYGRRGIFNSGLTLRGCEYIGMAVAIHEGLPVW